MSYIIQHVTVEGLWGVKSFDTDFHTDINIRNITTASRRR